MRSPRLFAIPVAALCGAALLTSAAAAKPKPSNTVRAVIWANTSITVAPKAVARGTVKITVKNRDSAPEQLEINGISTPIIQPGGSVEMTVVLKKPGVYSLDLPNTQQTYQNEYHHYSAQIKVK
jgi:Cupredoxin-like domain